MSDLRPDLAAIWDAFSVAATVTPPFQAPINTKVTWLMPESDPLPAGGAVQRSEAIRIVALLRSDVPHCPRETRITAAEIEGGPVLRWFVDGIHRVEPDLLWVIVIQEDSTPQA